MSQREPNPAIASTLAGYLTSTQFDHFRRSHPPLCVTRGTTPEEIAFNAGIQYLLARLEAEFVR